MLSSNVEMTIGTPIQLCFQYIVCTCMCVCGGGLWVGLKVSVCTKERLESRGVRIVGDGVSGPGRQSETAPPNVLFIYDI